ncbi:heme ABC exporter ATP-binding protein CcmA [Azorhizobium caulinodans]|uniref:heme ABC exporter ATP-binding protein CcmA n=1 Tax=Azorhizobium caulinodans TaxID=7 RepID=UPI002FBE1B0A
MPSAGGANTAPILHAQGLSCQRGQRKLFSRLSFEMQAGHALIVVGPNGAGKSSLLRIVAGLLTPTEGNVALRGTDPDLSLKEQLHYLGHDDALKGALSVRENLAFWRDVLGATGLSPADALEEVGLGGLDRLPASVLSAGQKRRLAIARLLVSKRLLWVLDEPTTALDVTAQARFAELARDHLSCGGLILAATHTPLDFGPSVSELRLGKAATGGV